MVQPAPLLKRGVFELDPDAPHPRDASVYGCTDTGGKSATVLCAEFFLFNFLTDFREIVFRYLKAEAMEYPLVQEL